MKKDILGTKDLETLKLNWKFHGPGLMDGRCNATGTCEDQPIPRGKCRVNHRVNFQMDLQSPMEIKLIYGSIQD